MICYLSPLQAQAMAEEAEWPAPLYTCRTPQPTLLAALPPRSLVRNVFARLTPLRQGTGQILFAKLLKGLDHIPHLMPLLREMILDARRNLQKCLPSHKSQLLQHLEPVGERLRTDMPQRGTQGVEAHGTLQQIHNDQQHPHISQETNGSSQGRGRTGFGRL